MLNFLSNCKPRSWFVIDCSFQRNLLYEFVDLFVLILFLSPDHFKGGQSGLSQSKNFLDPKELMELLKSRDYER